MGIGYPGLNIVKKLKFLEAAIIIKFNSGSFFTPFCLFAITPLTLQLTCCNGSESINEFK